MMINGRELSEPEVKAYIRELEEDCEELKEICERGIEKNPIEPVPVCQELQKWHSNEYRFYYIGLKAAYKEVIKLITHALSECRQISEYEAENKRLKELLRKAVEDFKIIPRQFEDEDGHCVSSISCVECRLNGKNLADECQWIHTEEAMELLGQPESK